MEETHIYIFKIVTCVVSVFWKMYDATAHIKIVNLFLLILQIHWWTLTLI